MNNDAIGFLRDVRKDSYGILWLQSVLESLVDSSSHFRHPMDSLRF